MNNSQNCDVYLDQEVAEVKQTAPFLLITGDPGCETAKSLYAVKTIFWWNQRQLEVPYWTYWQLTLHSILLIQRVSVES